MIDDGDTPGAHDAPFARTYDYFKHMTGIALISIGGVFAFLDGDGVKLDIKRSVVVLAFLGLSGATSLMMASYLAGIEVKPVPRDQLVRRIRIGGFVSTMGLAIGLGAFIQTFASALIK